MPFACGCHQPLFGSTCACRIRRLRMIRMAPMPLAPTPLAPLGELRGVIYRASRGPGEAPQNYVHFFEHQLPVLATDPTGRRLYIVGGRYRVTKRGIEG